MAKKKIILAICIFLILSCSETKREIMLEGNDFERIENSVEIYEGFYHSTKTFYSTVYYANRKSQVFTSQKGMKNSGTKIGDDFIVYMEYADYDGHCWRKDKLIIMPMKTPDEW